MRFYIVLFLTFLFSFNNYSYCGPVPFDFENTHLSNELVEEIGKDNLNGFEKKYQEFNMPQQLFPSLLSEFQRFLMCKLLISVIEFEATNIWNYLIDIGGSLCTDDERVQKCWKEFIEKRGRTPFCRWG